MEKILSLGRAKNCQGLMYWYLGCLPKNKSGDFVCSHFGRVYMMLLIPPNSQSWSWGCWQGIAVMLWLTWSHFPFTTCSALYTISTKYQLFRKTLSSSLESLKVCPMWPFKVTALEMLRFFFLWCIKLKFGTQNSTFFSRWFNRNRFCIRRHLHILKDATNSSQISKLRLKGHQSCHAVTYIEPLSIPFTVLRKLQLIHASIQYQQCIISAKLVVQSLKVCPPCGLSE